jgi:hypothetical protein
MVAQEPDTYQGPNISKKDHGFPRWATLIFSLTSLSFAFYLAVLSYEGFFTRYLADDFCYANPALHLGVFSGTVQFFSHWSGDFSAIFFTELGSILGPEVPTFLPIIWILLLLFSLYFLFAYLFQILEQKNNRIQAALLSFITVFFLFLMAPNRYQVLDWPVGSISYTAPLIAQVLLFAWFFRSITNDPSKINWFNALGIFLIAFIGAGFSETNTALLLSSLFIGIVICSFAIKGGKKWRVVRWQLIAFVGAFLGFLLMLFAPGNQVRQNLMPVPPSILEFLITSLQFGLYFLVNALRTMPVPIVLLFIISLLIGISTSHKRDPLLKPRKVFSTLLPILLMPVAAYVLWVSVVSPSVYFQSAYPENRALIGAMLILVLLIGLLGFEIGRLLFILLSRFPGRWQNAFTTGGLVLILLASAYPIRAAILLFPKVQKTVSFGLAWDKRDALIHQELAQHMTEVTVLAINSQYGIQELTEDPKNWVNKCIAEFYGLKSIVAH